MAAVSNWHGRAALTTTAQIRTARTTTREAITTKTPTTTMTPTTTRAAKITITTLTPSSQQQLPIECIVAMARWSKGLRFVPDPAASGADPAASGAGAPTTHLDSLLREDGFSSAEGHLDGHTMTDAILYGDGQRDARGAIRFFRAAKSQ